MLLLPILIFQEINASEGTPEPSPLKPQEIQTSGMLTKAPTPGTSFQSTAHIPTTDAESWARPWFHWLPVLWAIGSGGMLIAMMIGYFGTYSLRLHSYPANERIRDMGARWQHRLGMQRPVIVNLTDRLRSPVVVGILRPMILLPGHVATGLAPNQLEMILVHELAHLKRWDNLAQLLQRFTEALLFFQPLVWMLSRQASAAREACCDAIVEKHFHDSRTYAKTLCQLSEAVPTTVSAAADRDGLLPRLRSILGQESRYRPSPLGSAMMLLALLGSIAFWGMRETQAQTEPTKENLINITGTVHNSKGEPIAEAEVVVKHQTNNSRVDVGTTSTLADGSFALRVPSLPGSFDVIARYGGATQTRLLGDAPIRFEMPVRTYSGTVEDEKGHLVAGAKVSILSHSNFHQEILTDSEGAFAFEHVDHNPWAHIYATDQRGERYSWLRPLPRERSERLLLIVDQDPVTVSATVVDDVSGKPAAQSDVLLFMENRVLGRKQPTDANGQVRFTHLPPCRVRLQVRYKRPDHLAIPYPGYGQFWPSDEDAWRIALSEGREIAPVIEIPSATPVAYVRARLVDGDGSVLTETEIQLRHPGISEAHQTLTDVEGYGVFPTLADQESISLGLSTKAGHAGKLILEDAIDAGTQVDVGDISVFLPAALSGRLLHPDGQPAADAWVSVSFESKSASIRTNAKGEYAWTAHLFATQPIAIIAHAPSENTSVDFFGELLVDNPLAVEAITLNSVRKSKPRPQIVGHRAMAKTRFNVAPGETVTIPDLILSPLVAEEEKAEMATLTQFFEANFEDKPSESAP